MVEDASAPSQDTPPPPASFAAAAAAVPPRPCTQVCNKGLIICSNCSGQAGRYHSASNCVVDTQAPNFKFGNRHSFKYKHDQRPPRHEEDQASGSYYSAKREKDSGSHHRAKRDYSPRADSREFQGGDLRSYTRAGAARAERHDPFINADTANYRDKAHQALENNEWGFEYNGKDYSIERTDDGVFVSIKI